MGSLNTLWQAREIRKAHRRSPRQAEEIRRTRLSRILKHVLTKSPFYRSYYGEHGINLGNADTISLDRIPTIDKKIMMESFDDLLCGPELRRDDLEKFISDPSNRGKLYRRRYRVIHTSGSSGSIGLFIYGPRDWDILMAMVLTRVTRTRPRPFRKIRMAYIGATDGSYAGISLASGAPRALYSFLPLHINSPIDEIVSRIQEFQPENLTGYSSGVHLLAKEQLAGRLNIRPTKIVCSADPLTPEMRRAIRAAFGVDPVAFYAASESIALAAECEGHKGFHLFDDWHIFEFVGDDYKPVPAGEPGRLILTTLYNRTQPLIRYEMHDEIVLNEEPCPCSWSAPTIRRIGGRSENLLWFQRPDGRMECIHPLVIVEFMVPGLVKLQVVQPERNRLILRSVVRGNLDEVRPAIRERMNEILRAKDLVNVVGFDVETVDRIDNDPKTGKYKLIVPFKC